jgi:glycosyltransferase involved in cell wall biosynthesis
MIKISVVIPVYNTEKYLKECLESVLNQSLKGIEIICINDGSTDNSLKILESYSKNDSRIKIINQKNMGLSEARNSGIKIARGKYIHFLDSDDFYTNNDTLSILYKTIEKKELDILFFDIVLYYEKSNIELKQRSNNLEENKIYSGQEILINYIENENVASSSWSKLFRRKLLEESNMLYQKDIYFEDGEFLIRILSKVQKIEVIKENLITIRERENSITSSFKKEYISSIVTIFQTIDKIKNIEDYKKEFYKLGMVCYLLKLYLKSNIRNIEYEKEIRKLIKSNINLRLKSFLKIKSSIKRKIERILIQRMFCFYLILLEIYIKVR